jgi:hypothetical protein
VAQALQGQGELGDGVVFRTIAILQRKFVDRLRVNVSTSWHQ